MNATQRQEIFQRLREQNPAPTTELEYRNPFELLIAVILSAQATDVSVNKATRGLYAVANTPQAILALGLDGLKAHIRTIGLFNSKAENILQTCAQLERDHGGTVPSTREALEALPGVGRKTANVVLNTAFGEPTIAVDTHIFRVANRTGLARGPNPLAVETKLLRVTPSEYRKDAHHWLILHGRYTCKARKPECSRCIIADLCDFPEKTSEIAQEKSSSNASGKSIEKSQMKPQKRSPNKSHEQPLKKTLETISRETPDLHLSPGTAISATTPKKSRG